MREEFCPQAFHLRPLSLTRVGRRVPRALGRFMNFGIEGAGGEDMFNGVVRM